jgi:hypothetical protein
MSLSDGLNDPSKKSKVVANCTELLDSQVATMGGVSGLAIKAGYSTVKGLAPGYCATAVERLLPSFLDALDPIWDEGVKAGDAVGYMTQNNSKAANAILGITDSRIEKSTNKTLKGIYSKLRNSAQKHVENAVPDLAKVIDNYTKS